MGDVYWTGNMKMHAVKHRDGRRHCHCCSDGTLHLSHAANSLLSHKRGVRATLTFARPASNMPVPGLTGIFFSAQQASVPWNKISWLAIVRKKEEKTKNASNGQLKVGVITKMGHRGVDSQPLPMDYCIVYQPSPTSLPRFQVRMMAGLHICCPFVAMVAHVPRNKCYASTRCNMHINMKSSVAPVSRQVS